ncbi:MAG: TetR/AcrR family transcriptional regulator, partial [Gemmatimonadaceae bacterium]
MHKGERTREAIVAEAANLASLVGLHGLTIGTLAKHTGMSKSGLFQHFGSKEQLQVETLKAGV